MWTRLALRFGRTESELKRGITSTEFVRYQLAIEREQNEATVDHWYQARAASLLDCLPYRVWGQDVPESMTKPANYLLKFGTPEEIKAKVEVMSEEASANYAKLQKSLWLTSFGFDADGKKIEDGPVKTRVPKSMVAQYEAKVAAGEVVPPPPAPPPAGTPVPTKRKPVQVFTRGH